MGGGGQEADAFVDAGVVGELVGGDEVLAGRVDLQPGGGVAVAEALVRDHLARRRELAARPAQPPVGERAAGRGRGAGGRAGREGLAHSSKLKIVMPTPGLAVPTQPRVPFSVNPVYEPTYACFAAPAALVAGGSKGSVGGECGEGRGGG